VVALFKDKSPATIIWLFILSIIVHSHFLVEPPRVVAMEDDGLISLVLIKYGSLLNPISTTFIYHVLVLIQATRLNYLFSDNRMFSKVNYLTAMVYILLTALYPAWSNLTPSLIANVMVIWFFSNVIRLYNSPSPKTLIFNIGLIVGLSILLYHPCAILILVAVFALLVVRPFFIAEWIVLILGILSPYYFLFSFLYLTDRFYNLSRYIPQWELSLPKVKGDVLFFISIGVIIIILLIGIYYWQRENRRLIIQVRKNWIVLQVMLLVMLPLPFISYRAGIELLLLFLVPFSPFIAKGFLTPKKETLPNIMFWSLIILIAVNNWLWLIKY
jgi:hypothetical protein